MFRRTTLPLAASALLLIGASPAPTGVGTDAPSTTSEQGGVPDPYDVFPLGVCARVPAVDPRPFCVLIDPE